jgi:hypothetical protein
MAKQTDKKRSLTAGEIALARAAFGEGINYRRVRLHNGPGLQPLAHAAFARGNPAITVGDDIYFKTGYCADFSVAGQDRQSFIHEMTHVWQYEKLGLAAFFLRYGKDLAKAGGKPSAMYKYKKGTDSFGKAMLEAQASMVGDYSTALWAGDAPALAKLVRNMTGSGLYGL